MARSSAMLATIALAHVSGCDLVFGVDPAPSPCELGSFEMAMVEDIVAADELSLDWNGTLAVVMWEGNAFELDVKTSVLTPINLGLYHNRNIALSPEGNALLYTAGDEPPVLRGALRRKPGSWELETDAPPGTYAGTVSADAIGPRRLLVTIGQLDDSVVEYEDIAGRWTVVSGPHPLTSLRTPNLTPDALTMVYAAEDPAGEVAIFAAQRATTSEWFGEPIRLRSGSFVSAQLVGRCTQLYVTESVLSDTTTTSMMRRYER
jgi:hypothetical protein